MIERALIDDCIHCGFCLPTCPTYGPLWQAEPDSPRGRIHLMQALLDGEVALDGGTVEHFDRCLGCMACVTACPSGVRYDLLIEQTRAHVEEHYRRPLADRLLRTLLFAVLPHPRRLALALRLAPPATRFRRLAPPWRSSEAPPEVTPAAGPRRLRAGLMLGCVQRVVFGDVNAATARTLAADGCEVVAPREQDCCGALHLHAGRAREGHDRAQRLIDAMGDVDVVVTNAAGCGSHLKAFSDRVRDVSEVLAEVGPRAVRHELPVRVAFQDSCHLAHAQRVREEPRAMLAGIPGLELVEPAEQEICCGSAGIYNLVQPEAARELGERKAAHVLATGADVYASANPGCLVQVGAALRRAGGSLAVVHPVELVDASIRGVDADELLAGARR